MKLDISAVFRPKFFEIIRQKSYTKEKFSQDLIAGIIVGIVMCKRIPERTIKLVSAAAFIFFGFLGSYSVASEKLQLETSTIIIALTAIASLTGAIAFYLMRSNDETSSSLCEEE